MKKLPLFALSFLIALLAIFVPYSIGNLLTFENVQIIILKWLLGIGLLMILCIIVLLGYILWKNFN